MLKCGKAPKGWRCSRNGAHEGLCVAHPVGWRRAYWAIRFWWMRVRGA